MDNTAKKAYWTSKKVLVTGATGILGSWMVKELTEQGASVTGLIRDIRPESLLNTGGAAEKMNTVRGEIEDFSLLERVLNEYEIDTVFHLAAQAIVGTANRNPLSTFETNIRGTWNLLEAARRVSTVKAIVVASSDKAYGIHDSLPYTENMALQGRYPYDVSKSCTDLIAQSYYCTYGLPVCITRCGNFFGGGDLNFNRIIPGTIRSVIENEPPIIRSDGTFIRDYIYIRDVVHAYLLIAEKMADTSIHGEAFNISNEIQLTVLDLTLKLLQLMGRTDLKPVILNEAKGEIPHQYLSAEKARKTLDWKPQYTLEVALSETIEWYRGFFRVQSLVHS